MLQSFSIVVWNRRNLFFLSVLPATLAVCSSVPSQAPDAHESSVPAASEFENPQRRGAQSEDSAQTEFVFERGPLALFVREFSDWSGRNIVLMNGLELLQVGPYEFGDRTAGTILDRVAADAQLVVYQAPQYDLVLSEGYEELTRIDLDEEIDGDIAGRQVDARFGADTPLHSAFALLSHTLQTTVVADNIVASAASGEVQLTGVTFADALEALLQSARVAPTNVEIQSKGNVTFLYAPANPRRQGLLLNARDADPGLLDVLDRRVDLTLPAPPENPDHLRGVVGAVRLESCLESASAQLGIRLTADARAGDLPVNPAVMRGVSIRTALRLIIHQWPVADFGYVIGPEGIRIVHAAPPANPPPPPA